MQYNYNLFSRVKNKYCWVKRGKIKNFAIKQNNENAFAKILILYYT